MNLPSWKKVRIDIDHISSGHLSGGWRIPGSKKTLFPEYLSKDQIEKIVRHAYKNGKKVQSQLERVVVEGEYQGIKVRIHLNTENKIIESAYPTEWTK